jgi:putative Ca2+/H+ antiporter (TMEM165/GDT1 family)
MIDWKLLLSTFVLIFVAELPDKTAFATLLLATRKQPLAIFIGVAMAFVIQSVVASPILQRVPEQHRRYRTILKSASESMPCIDSRHSSFCGDLLVAFQ